MSAFLSLHLSSLASSSLHSEASTVRTSSGDSRTRTDDVRPSEGSDAHVVTWTISIPPCLSVSPAAICASISSNLRLCLASSSDRRRLRVLSSSRSEGGARGGTADDSRTSFRLLCRRLCSSVALRATLAVSHHSSATPANVSAALFRICDSNVHGLSISTSPWMLSLQFRRRAPTASPSPPSSTAADDSTTHLSRTRKRSP
mmetsp:Transcript_11224/g.25547  ORF Transcript_11224/g.25547 Transcript_11224/m.25547 type:complete len:202 (-) Transcript_11224:411-1016(-)